MGPTAAIMITDYWIVRKGNIYIGDAYTSKPGSRYMYSRGVNLNAAIAYVSGMLIPFVGFLGTFGLTVPLGASRCDEIGWYISAVVAGVVYVALSILRPLDNVDEAMGWEALASDRCSSESLGIQGETGPVARVVGDDDKGTMIEDVVLISEGTE